MLVGHLAVGLAAKRVEPKVSLGTFVLAAMLADLLSCVFMRAGLEHVQIQPGKGAANYLAAVDMPLSHSLAMDAVWAAMFEAAYLLMRRDRRGAGILAAVVLSHWVLDFVSHRPDMALAPGLPGRFGLADLRGRS